MERPSLISSELSWLEKSKSARLKNLFCTENKYIKILKLFEFEDKCLIPKLISTGYLYSVHFYIENLALPKYLISFGSM